MCSPDQNQNRDYESNPDEAGTTLSHEPPLFPHDCVSGEKMVAASSSSGLSLHT